jgi:hypothetical protein
MGGIIGPRSFYGPKEKLIGIVSVLGPSIRASDHTQLRAMSMARWPRPSRGDEREMNGAGCVAPSRLQPLPGRRN